MSTHLFEKYLAQTSDFAPFILHVDHAQGCFVFDKSGKRYFDFLSGMSVNNLGHLHPAVISAIEAQMKKNLHVMVYGEFIQDPQIELAERLCSLLPQELNQIFLLNSGTEAIEGAIKLARLYNKRAEIISFKNSYHGATMGAVSVMGKAEFQQVFQPVLPETRTLDFNDIGQLSQITERTSCVVVEPIQSGAGMNAATPAFLSALRKRCSEVNALLIFDEIQTGYGRTGHLYAFQHYEIVPDVLCIAKSFGAGLPLGGFVASEKLMKYLDNGHPLIGHATTSGGHPLSCAASMAALDIVSNPAFLEDVRHKGERIRELFQHPEVAEIRGVGMFLAAVVKHPEKIEKIVERLMANGFISFWTLFNKSVLELIPPLTITDDELVEASILFKKALDEVA